MPPKRKPKRSNVVGTRLTVVKKMPANKRGVCCVCGCSSDDPCHVHGVPCCWVPHEGRLICSACAPVESLVTLPEGIAWLKVVMDLAANDGAPAFTASDGQLARLGLVP